MIRRNIIYYNFKSFIYGNSHLWFPSFAKAADVPILVIFYEDLKHDVIPQMKRVYEFFKLNFNIEFEETEWRLKCMVEEL